MTQRFDFTFNLAEPKPALNPGRSEDEPMRILILGDFSGRGLSGKERKQGIGERYAILRVDIDNFEQVMSQIAPKLHIQLDHNAVSAVDLTFRQMDDFHPDILYRKLDLFQGLAGIRERLDNPATFAEAAEQLRDHLYIDTDVPIQKGSKTKSEDDAITLERLLGDRPANLSDSAERHAQNAATSFIQSVVAHAIVPEAPPLKDVYVKAVDEALSARMRKLLHHPDFQALEAAWCALERLVNSLETGETLSLYVFDIAKEELFAELSEAGENLTGSPLYRLIMEEGGSSFARGPWSVLIGNYRFGGSEEDVRLLGACGVMASHAGGSFIAEADPGLLGCRSLAQSPDPDEWEELGAEMKQRWQTLRQSPAASWIGLALPRILLRLPYGSATEPVECFDFEEIVSYDQHEAFLWGNPGFFCALLLGRFYLERGERMQPDEQLQIDDLPAYILKQNGGSSLLPCAEAALTDKAMEKILDLGIMPFLSHRTRNLIRLVRFQSLADPASGLRGFWHP